MKETNAKIIKTIERLSESEKIMSCYDEEDEESQNDKMETVNASENLLAHAIFSFNESEGKKKKKKNEHE